MTTDELVNVRYMVDDVQAAIDFYTTHLGFTLRGSAAPRVRGRDLRQPAAAAQRAGQLGRTTDPRRSQAGARRLEPHPPHRQRHRRRHRPTPPGWPELRNDIVTGPGGRQILLEDPSGNVIELFEPAGGSGS
jgi:catechol 2,3-dioxygenase-like lactoylglutathione lyase family enzyme